MNGRKRRIIIWSAAVLMLALVAIVAYRWHGKKPKRDGANIASKDRFSVVERGDFIISFQMSGELDAIERHMIKPAPGSGKFGLEIIQVVEDATPVEAGDVLFRFSDEKHRQQEDSLLLSLDDERTSLMLAEEDLQMTRVANLSSIKTAVDQLRSAQEAYDRYQEEDAVQKRRELLQAIDRARDKLDADQEALKQARNVLSDAYMQDPSKIPELEDKVEQAEKKIEQTQAELDKALSNLRVFKQYDHPQKKRSLQEAVTKNKMALQKTLVNAAGNILKSKRQIQNYKNRIRQKEDDLATLRKIQSQLVITAPVSGIVSLDNPQRRHWQNPADLKVGAQVREGQIIASIPDMSEFVVDIDITEELRSQVSRGQRAIIRSKALPDLVLDGEVDEIAPMAQNMITWDSSSPKIYPSKISTDSNDPRLMPGMTMLVEIVVEQVEDVIHVPVEAVYNREGVKYCRVKELTGVQERKVVTGRTSKDYAEIVSGLNEGEKVLLHQPGIME